MLYSKAFDPKYDTRTDIEADRWFVRERDSLVFLRAKEYIEKNKDERPSFF